MREPERRIRRKLKSTRNVAARLRWTLGSMIDTSAHIAGELAEWPSKTRIAAILRDADLQVYVGRYSIRVEYRSPSLGRQAMSPVFGQ